jgi:hypothetical protein
MAGHPTFGLAQRSNRWRRAGKMPDPAVTRLPDPNDSPLFTNRLNAKNETAFSLGQIESLRDWYDMDRKTLERVKGIEPSYSAWKAAALPLSYTRA